MKKLVPLLFLLCFSISFSQKDMPVGLHYVTVKNENAEKLIELETNYFSKLHKYAIDQGMKIAWDMWRVENDSDPQHTTFVYAHLMTSIEGPTVNWEGQNIFPQSELAMVGDQWWSLVEKMNFVMTTYKGGFAPISDKPVKYLQLSHMNVDPTRHYDYEKMELNDFMPSHKSNPYLKGWALHRIVSPHNEKENDYITANFFESMSDIYKSNNEVSYLSKQQKSSYQKILNIREMTKVEILSLVLSER